MSDRLLMLRRIQRQRRRARCGAAKVSATIPAAMPSRPNAALRWRSAWYEADDASC
ncbi:MAG: hypothetical protein WDN49_24700 [Acetobacteraceae bacterium]